MSSSTHYTARIDIKQVRQTEYQGTGRGDDKTTRTVTDITEVTLRAPDLQQLQTKVAAFVGLIGEE